jgi:chromatin remodeling complex protein RSC6
LWFIEVKQTANLIGSNGGYMAKKKATKKAAKVTKKAATKKAAPKKAATKKAGAKRKPNAAFMRALTPSTALAAIVGATPLPRTEVVKKLWAYIRKNNLQDNQNRRNINADDKLKPIFGKGQVSMFEMTKLVSKHLK